jgi:hypothetical protein
MEAMSAENNAGKSRVWLWFVAVMALQAAVWTAWLTVASHHRVAEVPLVKSP